jgi:hypothetical protein
VIVSIRSWFRTRASLQVEVLALRHQLAVLKRSQRRRLRLNSVDRLLWVWLSRLWSQWRSALLIVKPETVIAWHRKGSDASRLDSAPYTVIKHAITRLTECLSLTAASVLSLAARSTLATPPRK